MASPSRGWILSGIVVVLVIAVTPRAIVRIIETGNLYLLTNQFFQDILARLSGPGKLRFIIQPTVAIILGARDGAKDASASMPPFLWGLIFHRERRQELLHTTIASIRNLLAIAILLDLISQFLIFHQIRPGAALIVGPVLIAVPYALSRALANRAWHWKNQRRPTAGIS